MGWAVPCHREGWQRGAQPPCEASAARCWCQSRQQVAEAAEVEEGTLRRRMRCLARHCASPTAAEESQRAARARVRSAGWRGGLGR